MKSIELAPGIVLYKGIVLDIADEIMNIEQNQWEYEMVQRDGNVILDLGKRNTASFEIPFKANQNTSDIKKIFSECLNKVFGEIETDYCNKYFIKLKSHDSYKVLKYDVGGKFDLHMDDGGGLFRRVSCLLYLNDSYTGGELFFPNFNIKVIPEKGDFLVFPSSFIFTHKVSPVLSGTRYSIATWMR